MLIARRNMMAGKALPYDEELVYLESNGNQYIDIGINFTSEMSYAISGTLLALNGGICGSRVSAASENVMTNVDGNGLFVVDFGSYTQTRISDTVSAPFDFDISNSALSRSINDIYSSAAYTGSPFVSANTFHLFHVNNYTSPNATMMLFWFKINDGNYMDLKPVLKDGVPCLYDSVGGSFFYNSVSGHQFGYKRLDGTIVNPY